MWGRSSEMRTFGEIWPLWYGAPEVRNRSRAVNQLRTLADQNYAPAQFALGWAYFDGDGVRRNYSASFQLCLAAAFQGYPSAEGMVGNYYIMMNPRHAACPYNPQKAFRWHILAAKHGNPGAQYNLAFSYWTGRGIVRSAANTFIWASLSVHCSPLRNRTGEVLRDQAAAELQPEQRATADQLINQRELDLPHPWSEHMRYWHLLAGQAGVFKPSGNPEDQR